MKANPQAHLDLMEDLFYEMDDSIRLSPKERDELAKRTPEEAKALAKKIVKG